MFIIVRSPMARLISAIVALAIFAIVYFAVIKPDQNTANKAVTQIENATQQAIKQSSQSLGSVPATSGAAAAPAAAAADKAATTTANAALTQAAKLSHCIVLAGTDTAQIASCTARYKP